MRLASSIPNSGLADICPSQIAVMVEVEHKAVLSTWHLAESHPKRALLPATAVVPRWPKVLLVLCYSLVYLEVAWLITSLWRYSRD
jgi:hypothetical protein